MKLTVLVDNSTIIDSYFLGEPAVSYYLEDGERRVLFDTGYSDVFLQNASKLGIRPDEADYLVLSHGHIDHTGGLDPLLKRCMERRFEDESASCPELVAHPSAFVPKVIDNEFSIGTFVTKEACAAHMSVRETREPLWLTERVVFLGEIERIHDFEEAGPIGLRKEEGGDVPDDLPDDTALAYVGDNGLVVVTGCSHAGICNIVEQARRVTGVEKVHDIIGGFHLLEPSAERLEDTARCLESLELEQLGFAKKITIDKDTTTIVDGAGSDEEIRGRIAEIRTSIEKSDSDYDREKLEERLAKLAGGVAVINVGAATETEMKEKKARVEDALHATRAAVEEGIVPGGGAALLWAQKALDGFDANVPEGFGGEDNGVGDSAIGADGSTVGAIDERPVGSCTFECVDGELKVSAMTYPGENDVSRFSDAEKKPTMLLATSGPISLIRCSSSSDASINSSSVEYWPARTRDRCSPTSGIPRAYKNLDKVWSLLASNSFSRF